MPRSAPILLIFHPGALGDGLLALTALRAVQAKFYGHRMIWIGHKELGDVFMRAHEVHQSYSFDSLSLLAYGGDKGLQQRLLSSLFGRCERAVGWLGDSDGIWRSWFGTVGIKYFILCSPHDPSLRHTHMADRYVETLQPWFSTQQAFNLLEKNLNDERFLVLPQSKTSGKSCSSKDVLIILHPGSGGPHKCAPPALWVDIVNELMARPHWKVCLVGGPADKDALRRVQRLLTQFQPTILAGMDLLSVGRYLQHAQLFIGHDSGLSHLAGRLGVPSVLLFGPTDPAKWAPRGKHVAIMRNSCLCVGKESIDQCIDKHCFSLSTKEVMTKVEELLCEMHDSMSRAPLGFLTESPYVPCLG
jgi:ADP-heptose:LPS heptosyltransferase